MARELRSACQIEDMVHVALGRLNVTLTKAYNDFFASCFLVMFEGDSHNIQDGSLLVGNGVITPINGLINGFCRGN